MNNLIYEISKTVDDINSLPFKIKPILNNIFQFVGIPIPKV